MGVPWQVLAGLAWEQTRNGTQAPGEDLERSSNQSGVDPHRSLFLSRGLVTPPTVESSVFPELMPPITQPGYGMWLLNNPGALSDDPQSLPETVNDMAAMMAAAASSGRGGMPGSELLGRAITFGPTAQGGWVRIINQLPIVRAGPASATAAIGEAAAYSTPTSMDGTATGCPAGMSAASVTILGPPQASEAQMVAWYDAQAWYPPTVNGTPASTLIDDYYNVGTREGVRPDWAFVQAVLETGWFRSSDTALNNFAGIGHPESATSGLDFGTVLAGVTAQVQLLKRAVLGNQTALTLTPAPGAPRWEGRATTTWSDLTANWASSSDYGRSLGALHNDLTARCASPSSAQPASAQPAPAHPTPPSATTIPPGRSNGPAPPPAHPAAAASPSTTTTPAMRPGSGPPTTAPKTTAPVKDPGVTGSPGMVATVVGVAAAQVGKTWPAGSQGPATWDIPELAAAAYRAAGVAIPVDATALAGTGTAVADINHIQPGDLIFQAAPGTTTSAAGPQLVGVYQAGGMVVAAPDHTTIQLVTLTTWAEAELTMRRVLPPPTAP